MANTCADCGGAWEFGPGEADWFRARGAHPPKRCKPCRERRRVEREREARLVGTVVQARDEDGVIRAEDNTEFYFRMTDVAPEALPLRLGDRVTFAEGNRADGRRPRASLVHLVGS